MRVATRGAALSSRVVRFRVGLGGGYLWKLGRVRLWLSALVSVEPWFVRQGSDAGQLRRDGRDARPGVLLGGSLRFSPSYQIRLGRGDGGGLSLGPRLELAGSGSPDGGIASVAAASPDGGTRPLFRVGGLELGVSFELRGQFDLGDH
jgi:hypothetical protein